MKVPASIKGQWEKRFPDLSGKWTHWRLSGDGRPLGTFSSTELLAAMRLVESNCFVHSSIQCQMTTAECSEIDGLVVEIANISEHHWVRNDT